MLRTESKEPDIKTEEAYDEFQIGGNSDFKIGQKYPTPAPANGDRVFYESLLVQVPTSEMAQEWCVAYGVLDDEKARKVDKIICTRKGTKPSQSPKKVSTSTSSTTSSSNATKEKEKEKEREKEKAKAKKNVPTSKKAKYDDDIIVDTGLGESSMWEGQGAGGI